MNRICGVLFIVSLISCGGKISNSNDNSITYIDKMIQNDLLTIKGNNPHDKSSIGRYKFAKSLVDQTDSIVTKINNGVIKESEWNSYLTFFEKFVEPKINKLDMDESREISYLSELRKIEFSQLNNKDTRTNSVQQLKLIELMLVDQIKNMKHKHDFPINIIFPTSIAKENSVKLGNTYEAQIGLMSWNTYDEFIAIVNGDTLAKDSTGLPVFKTTPTSKGLKTHKCIISDPHNSFNWNFEFIIEYKVE